MNYKDLKAFKISFIENKDCYFYNSCVSICK